MGMTNYGSLEAPHCACPSGYEHSDECNEAWNAWTDACMEEEANAPGIDRPAPADYDPLNWF